MATHKLYACVQVMYSIRSLGDLVVLIDRQIGR